MFNVSDNKIKWFKDARFGLFIHWGLYSATEGYWNGIETEGICEWIASREKIPNVEYEKFAERLTCEKFEPKKWARLAKSAGMKYCVFTAKHHEGFAMYDTSYDDYSIVKRSPYGADVTKQIVDAMKEEGIIPCLYYSHALDFHEPNAMGNTWDYTELEDKREFQKYLDNKCKYQLSELLTNYGDIGMLWLDVPKGITEEMALDIKSYIEGINPHCLVSGRLAYDHSLADFGCLGDNQMPAAKPTGGCWETAATMSRSWGYKRDDREYKSPKEIIEILCGLLSKGCNLLLNIGPKPDGEITEESIYILSEIGKWMSINAEAVYGTEASPFECDFSFGGVSCKEDVMYLYIHERRECIDIYGLENKVLRAIVLGGTSVECIQDDLLHIDLSNVSFGKYVTVVKLELDGNASIKHGVYQQEKGNIILHAGISTIVKSEEILKSDLLVGDDALEAENINLASGRKMEVDVAGFVRNWWSERNYLQWEIEAEEEGMYEIYLYTITQKYKEWIGGHKVHVVCNGETKSKIMTADKESSGANKRYFAETGSYLGNIYLQKGKQKIELYADKINKDDPMGLSMTKMVMVKNNINMYL